MAWALPLTWLSACRRNNAHDRDHAPPRKPNQAAHVSSGDPEVDHAIAYLRYVATTPSNNDEQAAAVKLLGERRAKEAAPVLAKKLIEIVTPNYFGVDAQGGYPG